MPSQATEISNGASEPSGSDMDGDEGGMAFDVAIVGAGAAGVGVAHALLRCGMPPSRILLIERGSDVGSSFREWHASTRFITPSFPSYPFGPQDLNSVVPDTSVHAPGQHPSGADYAAYLERMMAGSNLTVALETEVADVRLASEEEDGDGEEKGEEEEEEEEEEEDVFLIEMTNGDCVLASYVVWAAGEWANPALPPADAFPPAATVHYRAADLDALAAAARGPDAPVVLVGGGEAGADVACALAEKGARKVIVLEAQEAPNDSTEHLDPSRRLTAATRDRLQRAGATIDMRCGTTAVGVSRDEKAGVNTVRLRSASSGGAEKGKEKEGGKTWTISTPAHVVLCTGFDISRSKMWNRLFAFENGYPKVNLVDESTKTANVFLSGPMLRHQLVDASATCELPAGSSGGGDEDDRPMELAAATPADAAEPPCEDDNNIIFCFIYKFRARFAVVAGEIVRRIVRGSHTDEAGNPSEAGKTTLDAVAKMQAEYASKGMMLTDLSCTQLACGMTKNDAPDYGYKHEGDEDDGEAEEG